MAPTHRFHSVPSVLGELLCGRTIARAYLNLTLKDFSVGGRILDIGAKTASASYWRYLRQSSGTEIIPTDLEGGPGVAELNVENPFPFENEHFDIVIALNLFEHVRNLSQAPAEIARILKPGGRFIVSVPFLYPFHADPDDFRRLTDSGLASMFAINGMKVLHSRALGEGAATLAAEIFCRGMLPSRASNVIFPVLYPFSTLLDRLVAGRRIINGRTTPQRYPAAFLMVLEKTPR